MAPKTKKSSSTSSSSSSSASSTTSGGKTEPKTKIDPSFKSKRYRDKLRTEVKALESLLPVDRTSLSRKLDSQTVFRLVLALLRVKGYFQDVWKQPDWSSLTSRPYDVTANNDVDHDDITSQVQGLASLQVLEGFLLVLTADGTILYVSDNVTQYLGYNQVDLLHRCLYSVVHREDHPALKDVLENSLPTPSSSSLHHRGHHHHHHHHHPRHHHHQDARHPMEDCSMMAPGDMSAPLSSICRMRCFSGSSVGYLKMHCSGKMVNHPTLPRAKRTSSSQVALLFCQPFMLRAAKHSPDLQNSVFWTKHDLALRVTEMDPKGTDLTGYTPEEMEKQSFYSLLHPEDLSAMAACHKLLVDSSEVQTVYFRLQSKAGDWLWLTSRGKVISKNSKKFSIAFSHCPLRDEDSAFIQQEAALRRRFALADLAHMGSSSQLDNPHSLQHLHPSSSSSSSSSFSPTTATSTTTTDTDSPLTSTSSSSSSFASSRQIQHQSSSTSTSASSSLQSRRTNDAAESPSAGGRAGDVSGDGGEGGGKVGGGGGGGGEGRKEDAALMDTSCVLELVCPSAWHSLGDRHSPVLPSSHVAHKLSQREKQLQFQQFCKRQHVTESSAPPAHGHTAASANKLSSSAWDGGAVPVPLYAPASHHHAINDLPSSSTTGAVAGQHFSSAQRADSSDACINSMGGFYHPAGYGGGLGSFGGGMRANEYPVQGPAGHHGGSYLSSGGSLGAHWYSGGAVSMPMVSQHPSPSDCLTPCRSPHHPQGGLPHAGSSSHGPGLSTTHGAHLHHSQFLTLQPQLSSSAYSSMPPSPPPSPQLQQSASRSFLPGHHHAQDTALMESGDVQQLQTCRPQVVQPWQSCYYPAPQPMPFYPHRGEDVAPALIPPSPASSVSTLTDLQKTTEKFLPYLKRERQGECKETTEQQGGAGLGVQRGSERHTDQRQHAHARYPADNGYHSLPVESWVRPQTWTVNGQLDISPPSTNTALHPFRHQVSVNGSVNIHQSLTNCSERPPPPPPPSHYTAYGQQGFHNSHHAHNYHHGMFHASMTQPAYPYHPGLYSHLGSRPANTYGGGYAQTYTPGGQYQYQPVNGFYAASSDGAAKRPVVEMSCPPAERPLDLPSIGSFLEYLNEV